MIDPKAQQKMNPMARPIYNQQMPGAMANMKPTAPAPKPVAPAPKPKPKATPKTFQRPIPGQSLTAQPKNRPYERPPEITDPEEALRYHITRLTDPEILDNVVLVVQKEVPVKDLVEGIMRGAVSEGIHTIDTSLVISPTVHEFIEVALDELQVPYKSGFENNDEEKKRSSLLKDMVRKSNKKKSVVKSAPKAEGTAQIEMDLGEPEAEPKGLMARA